MNDDSMLSVFVMIYFAIHVWYTLRINCCFVALLSNLTFVSHDLVRLNQIFAALTIAC